jgi:hypothetical protein
MGLLTALLGFVFFAGWSMTVNEGLWSNTITLLLILISAAIAFFWGPVLGVAVIVAAQPSAEYAWAFIFAGVWGVYALAMTILRMITDRLSRVRLRFVPLLDKLGGIVVGLGVATMFNSFVACTLLIPFNAEVWKPDEGSETQQKTMTRAMAPMYTALTRFYGGEFADLIEQAGD